MKTKKVKINIYHDSKTIILLNVKIAFVDNINERLGYWFKDEIKLFGKITKWNVDISQHINFIMITFNYSWQFDDFITSLDKKEYIIKEFKNETI